MKIQYECVSIAPAEVTNNNIGLNNFKAERIQFKLVKKQIDQYQWLPTLESLDIAIFSFVPNSYQIGKLYWIDISIH